MPELLEGAHVRTDKSGLQVSPMAPVTPGIPVATTPGLKAASSNKCSSSTSSDTATAYPISVRLLCAPCHPPYHHPRHPPADHPRLLHPTHLRLQPHNLEPNRHLRRPSIRPPRLHLLRRHRALAHLDRRADPSRHRMDIHQRHVLGFEPLQGAAEAHL